MDKNEERRSENARAGGRRKEGVTSSADEWAARAEAKERQKVRGEQQVEGKWMYVYGAWVRWEAKREAGKDGRRQPQG